MSDLWSVIAAERAALADDLSGIADTAWDRPSLCDKWSVRDVIAHIVATAEMTPLKFPVKMLASGFSFQKMVAADIADKRGASPADTLARLRSVRDRRTSPPGPKVSWLGETIVHAEDARRPLGIERAYPMDSVVEVADFYKGSNTLIGSKRRIEGLNLRATDTEWTLGTGPVVEGPMLSLLLAMTGRSAASDDLTGDGVPTLRSR